MLGILMVWSATGSLGFSTIAQRMGNFTESSALSDRRGLARLLRGSRKVGAIPAPRLVAGRDGRPDPGFAR